MNFEYPPTTEKATEIDQLIQISRCILGKNKAIYISTPISSGKRFNEWHQSVQPLNLSEEDYKKRHHKEVIVVNQDNAAEIRLKLLKKNPEIPVINPGGIFYPHWSQNDYLCFWEKFIINFVKEIVFVDGWQYSNGSTFEYVIAYKNNIPTFDINHKPLECKNVLMLLAESTSKDSGNFIFEAYTDLIAYHLANKTERFPD